MRLLVGASRCLRDRGRCKALAVGSRCRDGQSDNPLAHRVWVNRVWAHLFGRGIVPTVDNFGAMGRAATHPELLDWMVVRFREHDASLKQLVRDLCLSRTFAMSTTSASPLADQLDAANDWLHVQRVRRLEGETLRDHILVMSDALDHRAFGPSVPTHDAIHGGSVLAGDSRHR
ncbi:MAG: DUF1553 domain-containing protein [Pirellulaceae bacterium]